MPCVGKSSRRQVLSSVLTEDAALIGSQPWPVAAGHSELMLGCIAIASSENIAVNRDEMESGPVVF